MKLKNVANVNTLIHGIILRNNSRNLSRPADGPRFEQDTSGECQRDSGDGNEEEIAELQ